MYYFHVLNYPTEDCIVLPVVLYGCDIWSDTDLGCFRTGCWREYLDL